MRVRLRVIRWSVRLLYVLGKIAVQPEAHNKESVICEHPVRRTALSGPLDGPHDEAAAFGLPHLACLAPAGLLRKTFT